MTFNYNYKRGLCLVSRSDSGSMRCFQKGRSFILDSYSPHRRCNHIISQLISCVKESSFLLPVMQSVHSYRNQSCKITSIYYQERMSRPKGGRSAFDCDAFLIWTSTQVVQKCCFHNAASPRSAFVASRVSYENNTSGPLEFRSI